MCAPGTGRQSEPTLSTLRVSRREPEAGRLAEVEVAATVRAVYARLLETASRWPQSSRSSHCFRSWSRRRRA